MTTENRNNQDLSEEYLTIATFCSSLAVFEDLVHSICSGAIASYLFLVVLWLRASTPKLKITAIVRLGLDDCVPSHKRL